jgi:CRISPR-associated exonuclease Cas4
MNITGTHFAYFQICHRKLWLFSNGINMEQYSELVDEGRLIHETSYQQRPNRYEELEIDGIKIDYYDPAKKCIHEIKKSASLEPAHEWQLKYYLYVMKRHGIEDAFGILEYPRTRQTKEVWLNSLDEESIAEMLLKIKEIIQSEHCPEKQKMKICKNCAYHDFCWTTENTDKS